MNKLNYGVWIKTINTEKCISKFLQFSVVQHPMTASGGMLLNICSLHKYQVETFYR